MKNYPTENKTKDTQLKKIHVAKLEIDWVSQLTVKLASKQNVQISKDVGRKFVCSSNDAIWAQWADIVYAIPFETGYTENEKTKTKTDIIHMKLGIQKTKTKNWYYIKIGVGNCNWDIQQTKMRHEKNIIKKLEAFEQCFKSPLKLHRTKFATKPTKHEQTNESPTIKFFWKKV